ncbi:MAG: CerR family C-terminal domain-containing protein [Planctomycetota bacterium]|nr:CerR family C-terminal domain-containing protein [Planctomycetota bacterium]
MAGRRGKRAAKSKATGATRGVARGGAAAGTQTSAREVVTNRDAENAALAAALREHARSTQGGSTLQGRAARPESVEIPTLRGADTVTSKKLLQGLAKRDRLLDAAITAFAAHGAEGASVRDICAAAGANVAAVKYYFNDKGGLYEAAILAAADSLLERLPEPNLLAISEPIAALHSWIRWAVEFTVVGGKRRAALTKIILREMREPTPAFERLFLQRAEPLVQALHAIIAQVIEAERSTADPQRTVACVLVLAMQYEHSGEFLRRMKLEPPSTPREFDELAGVILDMTMGMIRARTRVPPAKRGAR